MSLPSSLAIEVNTTGLDTNGGGFDPAVTSPGTDYTYPTSSPIAYSDLVIAATTTNVSSAARAFIAADVGNTLNVTSGTGFTAGRYSVRSVAAGVATLDAAVGTAGSAAGVGRLGGAIASPGMAAGVLVPGNSVFQRSGTYNITSVTANVSGGVVSPQVNNYTWQGYGATRGDNGTSPVFLASGISTVTLFTLFGSQIYVTNLAFNGANLAGMIGMLFEYTCNYSTMAFRCVAYNCISGFYCRLNYLALLTQCESYANTNGVKAENNSFALMVRSCYIHGNSIGVRADNQGAIGLHHCLIVNNTSHGYSFGYQSRTPAMFACTLSGNGGYGVSADGGTQNALVFENCIFYGNTSGSIGGPVGGVIRNCANGTGFAGSVEGAITLTASPFVNAAGGDFRLNNVAGGGALCRGAGYAPALPALTAVNAQDLGVYQHATPALALAVNATGANPVLTWDADSRAVTGYVISRGTTATNKADIAAVALATTTYTDTAVTSGTFFYGVASY